MLELIHLRNSMDACVFTNLCYVSLEDHNSAYFIYWKQGRRKLFITGQVKLNPKHYSIKCVDGSYPLSVSYSITLQA